MGADAPVSTSVSSETLPPGCQGESTAWPWLQPLAGAHCARLHFAVDALSEADLSAWQVALPERLASAAAKRRAEYLAGRLCARQALGALTGTPATPQADSERLPLWPAGCVGSITHSQGLAASVVAERSRLAGIGLDAEGELDPARALRLAPQILVESEREWLASLPPAQQAAFVTQVFSLKESLFKALYPLVRQRFYFPHARLVAWQPAAGAVTLELGKTLSPQWPAGRRLSGQVARVDGYHLTLVTIPRQS